MAKIQLNQDESKIQSAIADGKYAEAQKMLTEPDREIRPLYQAIFEASIGFAAKDIKAAYQAVSDGLRADGRSYELYMMLGDCCTSKNLQQAYLCYENALFYCDDPEDAGQIRAVLDHLTGLGVRLPKTAVVILSYNLLDMTRDCVESILDTTPESAREIIVVDNASTDGSVDWLKSQKEIKLLCNSENKGFPAACNQGIELAEKDSDIFLLNNDTVMTDNALFWLRMGLYEDDQVGSAGCVTNNVSNLQTVIENGKTKEEYLEFAKKTNVPMERPYLNKVHLVGFALLLKRTVLDEIGLLDERFSPGNYEDNDICLRIALSGHRNVLCRNSFIIHWGSQSFIKNPQKFTNVLDVNQAKFFEKWSSIRLEPAGYWNTRQDLVSVLGREHNVTNDVIMVVGTGCGIFLSVLKDRFPEAQIFGLEPHQYMARIADRIADTVWVDLDEWKGDELAETFDFVIINDSLEYVADPAAVLAEFAKMLKKDGKMIVSFVNGQHFSRIGKSHGGRNLFDREQMMRTLSSAGLTGDSWVYTQAGDSRSPELAQKIREAQEQYPSVEREALIAYQWITTAEKQRSDIRFCNKMAVCIPTYQRSEVIEDVLLHCAETYKRYGLDVYYYDSSEDDKTRNVIEAYRRKGYENLYYIPTDLNKITVFKGEYILMMNKIQKEYDYMWYLRDRCWCEEKTLKLMYKAMEKPHDIIFLDVGHPDSQEELSECRNANEFYHRCGDYATSMDTTIYNVKSILKDGFNIEEFCEKHGEYRDAFAHFLIIFEQLAKKEEPNICLLAGRKVTIYHSNKIRSGWHERRINIWGKYWIQVNEALPDCYTDKDDVIKRTASFPWLLGDLNALIDLHDKGVLTPEYYEEIKVFWERVSNIPLETLRQIARGEYNIYQVPPQLKQDASFVMNIFLQTYEAVLEGGLAPESVPVKEIIASVKSEAAKHGININAYLGIIDKLLENIRKIAEEKPGDKERMLMALQMIIGVLLLIER